MAGYRLGVVAVTMCAGDGSVKRGGTAISALSLVSHLQFHLSLSSLYFILLLSIFHSFLPSLASSGHRIFRFSRRKPSTN